MNCLIHTFEIYGWEIMDAGEDTLPRACRHIKRHIILLLVWPFYETQKFRQLVYACIIEILFKKAKILLETLRQTKYKVVGGGEWNW
jgi:hypothetical protein